MSEKKYIRAKAYHVSYILVVSAANYSKKKKIQIIILIKKNLNPWEKK